MFEQQEIESPTGAKLSLWMCPASGPAKGVIQICHGMGEHAKRYARFADAMAEAGYAVFAEDHRGHGATVAPDAPPGFFAEADGWNQVLADKAFVNRHIHDLYPELPVIMLGHSLGGTLAFSYALRFADSINAVAVWNATTNSNALHAVLKFILFVERLLRGRKAVSIVNALTFVQWGKAIKPRRTDFDWLSHDETEVDKYIADPLCGWPAPNSLWGDVSDGMTDCADGRKLDALPRDLPFNLLGGDQDPATEGGKAVLDLDQRLKSKGFSNVITQIMTNTRHETLNEVDRAQTTKDFIAWADQIVESARTSSGGL
ncbi:MAG: alpha/beta hydrolase [Alphaproteobacteria bacterium]|jgi:alpha-beta hydrolase superfamily lysophospholipase|nr:alpha/beta hydrolase [Alphaproteobacteria bacterium]MBT4082674.1 alpha/beta hydrolase [Alphaproteobacteria bacterium]MBT4543664.1 alpha/beta hydrolase [Alphaproteobacteria bacterium]MBT7744432.1 alpha/beta hydrolase [Alphaproteobacteria bacterium]